MSATGAGVLRVQKIWDASPYNAFTGLARHGGEFFCAFREGATHVSMDGTVRVLSSEDGRAWRPVARMAWPGADVRDAKLSVSPQGYLLLHTGVRSEEPKWFRSTVWRSRDGREWGQGRQIVDADIWLWGIAWHKGVGYGMGYGESLGPSVRLYTTTDGLEYQTRVANIPVAGQPSEHAMVFLDDDTAVCLLRRDGKERNGWLGTARPPYTQWAWKDLGQYAGGPAMIRIPDGRIIAAPRLLDERQYQRVGLCWIDPAAGTMKEFLVLPGAQSVGPARTMGDWGYAGMVFHEGTLWVSYYAPDEPPEGKTSIYLAQVALPPAG